MRPENKKIKIDIGCGKNKKGNWRKIK